MITSLPKVSENFELMKEWDFDKNQDISSEKLSMGSKVKVWWKCSKGHSWQTAPKERKKGRGCPICANKKVLAGYNDLASQKPELLKEWDFDKNQNISPEELTMGSNIKVWWKCSKGHSWQIAPTYRIRGSGCPICANKKVLVGYNDLASQKPELLKEWDYEKNQDISPEELIAGSRVKVWWKCSKGHSWQVAPAYRVSGSGCPVCANKKVLVGYNDLASQKPELLKEWDYEKNQDISPEELITGSNVKVWWKCSKGHSWYTSVSKRSHSSNGCPYCVGQKAWPGENDLETINPELAKEWDYEKNGCVTPNMIMAGSNKAFWWKCDKGHSWKAVVSSRKRNGCPYCSGRKALKGINDFKTLQPALATEWDYEKNGELKPTDVSEKSNKKVWWKCKNGHSWKASPYLRYSGCGCPQCEGRTKMKTHYIS